MAIVSTHLYYSRVTPPAEISVAVVIDVLRATTVICAALDAGATGIVPVTDKESAHETADRLSSNGRNILIGGERNGYRIPGFHFGNSPVEYSAADLSGKTIIQLTTNGTAAIGKLKTETVGSLYAAAFVNLSATARALARLEVPVMIVCGGSNGLACLEDTLCAGALVREMYKLRDYVSDDTSLIAADLYDRNIGNMETFLLEKCKHGRYLASIGYEEDVKYASRLDLFDFAVKLDNGVLVKDNAKS